MMLKVLCHGQLKELSVVLLYTVTCCLTVSCPRKYTSSLVWQMSPNSCSMCQHVPDPVCTLQLLAV